MTRGNPNKCYYCGHEEKCTKEHFIPKSKRGFLKVWACSVCQGSKGKMMPIEWVEYLRKHPLIDKAHVMLVKRSVDSLWLKVLTKQIPAYHIISRIQ